MDVRAWIHCFLSLLLFACPIACPRPAVLSEGNCSLPAEEETKFASPMIAHNAARQHSEGSPPRLLPRAVNAHLSGVGIQQRATVCGPSEHSLRVGLGTPRRC